MEAVGCLTSASAGVEAGTVRVGMRQPSRQPSALARIKPRSKRLCERRPLMTVSDFDRSRPRRVFDRWWPRGRGLDGSVFDMYESTGHHRPPPRMTDGDGAPICHMPHELGPHMVATQGCKISLRASKRHAHDCHVRGPVRSVANAGQYAKAIGFTINWGVSSKPCS